MESAKLPGYEEQVSSWTLPVVSTFRTNNGAIGIIYDGHNWEQSSFSSTLYQTTVQPKNAAQYAHGQVYFKWNGASSRFELCPLNGPGGLIVDGAMRAVPIDCLTLAQGATASSALNYFYAAHTAADVLTVSSVTSNPSGNIRLIFSSTVPGNAGDGVAIGCHSIDGVIQANGNDAGVIVSSSTIDLLHTPSPGSGTASSGGTCELVRLASSTTGHSTFADGVEIGPDEHYTLAGIAYIGASNAVNDSATKRDVASWFNRKAKTCINNYTADRSFTGPAVWTEPNFRNPLRVRHLRRCP